MNDNEIWDLTGILKLTPERVKAVGAAMRRMEDRLLDCVRPGLQELDLQLQTDEPESLAASSVHLIATTVRLAIRDFPLKLRADPDYVFRIRRLASPLLVSAWQM